MFQHVSGFITSCLEKRNMVMASQKCEPDDLKFKYSLKTIIMLCRNFYILAIVKL